MFLLNDRFLEAKGDKSLEQKDFDYFYLRLFEFSRNIDKIHVNSIMTIFNEQKKIYLYP